MRKGKCGMLRRRVRYKLYMLLEGVADLLSRALSGVDWEDYVWSRMGDEAW